MTLADSIVVLDPTLGVDAAGAGAGVHAVRGDAGLVGGTVVVEETLGLALDQWVALVVPGTLADSLATLRPALRVHPAGRGVAGAGWLRDDGSYGPGRAAAEGVPDGARRTGADGVVVSHLADGGQAAGAGAGVQALAGYTGQAGAAVRVGEALRPAAGRAGGVPEVSGAAGTHHVTAVLFCALGVLAAGRWLARVGGATALERVPCEAGQAAAVLARVIDETLSILPAGPGLAECQHRLPGRGDGDAALDGVDGLGVSWLAGTALHVVHHHALGVGATRVGFARFHRLDAGDEGRVPLEAGQAVADRAVRHHPAAGVGAALVAPAPLPVLDASHERVAGLSARTRTDRVAVVQLADGAGAAGGGLAGVGRDRHGGAAHVRVALHHNSVWTKCFIIFSFIDFSFNKSTIKPKEQY